MTDIIKDFEQVISGNVVSFLKNNITFEQKNIDIFQNELKDLRINSPLIFAFGNDSFNILYKYFHETYKIVKIPHYSKQISKEKYKYEIEEAIKDV